MPKFIDVVQGSESWLELRRKCVTATDIGILMHVNPWKSPFMLFQEKLGIIEPQPINEAMRRGSEMEPLALAYYNDLYVTNFIPKVCVHDDNNRFMASLDGWSDDEWSKYYLIEIKCGKKAFDEIEQGIIAEYYMYQMQWQMYCTRRSNCVYFVFDGKKGFEKEVIRNDALIDKMIPAAEEFLRCLDTLTPPPLTDLDYVDRTNDCYLHKLIEKYDHLSKLLSMNKISVENIKNEILQYCQNTNTKASNGKITRITTKGRIQYDSIPALTEIDLEPFRGSDIISYRITKN